MPVEAIDEHFTRQVRVLPDPGPGLPGVPEARAAQLVALFRAQAQSRHLDFAARWLEARGDGFYTIGSAGHEANGALGLLSAPTDPALLHYRSGGFYAARAAGVADVDPVRDVLRSMTGSASDPMSGGRHKVVRASRAPPRPADVHHRLPPATGGGARLRAGAGSAPGPGDAVAGRRGGALQRRRRLAQPLDVRRRPQRRGLRPPARARVPAAGRVRGQRDRHQHPDADRLAGHGPGQRPGRALPRRRRQRPRRPARRRGGRARRRPAPAGPGHAAPAHGPADGACRVRCRDRLPVAGRHRGRLRPRPAAGDRPGPGRATDSGPARTSWPSTRPSEPA